MRGLGLQPQHRSSETFDSIRSRTTKGGGTNQAGSDGGRRGTGGLGLEVAADPLDDLPPLGAVLQEPLGAAGLDLLGDGGELGERAAPDRGLLPELRPVVGAVRVGAEGGSLLDLDDPAEADVADDDVHGAARGVDDGGLDAVADGGARGGGGGGREEAAQDEGERRGADGDGARGVEAAGGRVDAALQGVHVGDVGERRAGGRVRELAPRRRRHAVPRVPVDVLLRVDHHGRGSGWVGGWLAGFWISPLDFLLAARV
uniref:Uncharacterized protein n=1 Tax=Triticum urartu TaxID=4572 RepID=A0A8R7QU45_TRIUA